MGAPSQPELIVVGGGMAGCEAAYAVARAGASVMLVSTSLDTLYVLAHDEYALTPPPGSLLAACAPAAAARPAGEGPLRYSGSALRREAKRLLEAESRLHLLQSTASELLVEGGAARGVATWEGVDRPGARVALCVGSFLGARLTVGTSVEQAGRLSEMAYDDLRDDLRRHGFGFSPAGLELAGLSGALPYAVNFEVFAAGEWTAADMRLPRLAGLYAAGACVGRLGYEVAVADGMALASAVLADIGSACAPS